MKQVANGIMVVAMAAVLSGCAGAAFNRISVTANRHITIGQELMDLKEAHEKGIINDTEYIEAKKSLLNIAEQYGAVNVK